MSGAQIDGPQRGMILDDSLPQKDGFLNLS